jgi:hypothetical protein
MDRIENNASNNDHLFWRHYSGFQESGGIHRHKNSKVIFHNKESRLKKLDVLAGTFVFNLIRTVRR